MLLQAGLLAPGCFLVEEAVTRASHQVRALYVIMVAGSVAWAMIILTLRLVILVHLAVWPGWEARQGWG